MRLPIDQEKKQIIANQAESLSFEAMVNYFRSNSRLFPDKQTGSNATYSMEDLSLGAFSIFFTQSPSFLAFQKAMQKNKGVNNAQSLFGVKKIACDNHIRSLLDEVAPSYVFPVFTHIIEGLKGMGHLDTLRS